MLYYLFRWIFGYVKFSFENGFTEGFLNELYDKKINIHSLKKTQNALTGTIAASKYKTLHRIAYHNGGKVKIIRKSGLSFLVLPLKSRFGLFFGGIIFMILLSFFSGSIWNVQVVGNDKISEEKLVVFLEQNGVKVGARTENTEFSDIECDLMANFSEISWAKINKIGTTARLEIEEGTPAPEIVNEKATTNVKAKKDGVIVEITANKGWSSVKVGDAVTKGDLLISGIKESEVDKKNYYAHARGVVKAEVNDKISLTINKEQASKICKSIEKRKYFVFFGLKLPLFINWNSNDTNKKIEKQYSYIKLNKVDLPIGIETKTLKTYENTTTLVDEKELKLIAKEKMDKKISEEYDGAEIISKDFNYDFNDNSCRITAEINAIEEIGEEISVKIDK